MWVYSEVNAAPTLPEIIPRIAPIINETPITISGLLKLPEVNASIVNAFGVCSA